MAASQRAAAHLQRWLVHRRPLQELVDRLPPSATDFRPWEGAMTTVALVAHIVRASERFQRAAERGAFEAPPDRGTRPSVPETIAAAADLLRRSTQDGVERLSQLTDAQMDAVVEFGRMPLKQPVGMLLTLAIDHEVHHKGQLWVYARMCGVEPPPFASRPS